MPTTPTIPMTVGLRGKFTIYLKNIKKEDKTKLRKRFRLIIDSAQIIERTQHIQHQCISWLFTILMIHEGMPLYSPRVSLYLSASSATLNVLYSTYVIFPSKSSKSTLNMMSLAFVKRWRLSSPSQNSPLKLPNPSLKAFQSRKKSTEPSKRLWKTVQPPPSVVMSHNTGIGLPPSGLMVYTPLEVKPSFSSWAQLFASGFVTKRNN